MRSIEIRAAPNGKPLLFGAEARVAIAHSGGILALYVGREDAGIDVELPSAKCFNGALIEAVEAGRIDETLLDRALRRVLRQKAGFA